VSEPTFSWRGRRLPYFDHPYNSTRANERAVELAVAEAWLEELGDLAAGPGLEVGNVLGHNPDTFGRWPHRVVDRYEGPELLDVFEISDSFSWIVAISTLEHVRWDPPEPRDPAAAVAAVRHLLELLEPGGSMLVSVPLGWHEHLDAAIAGGELEPDDEAVFYRRGAGWAAGGRKVWRPYGVQSSWADAVWLATWSPAPAV
jgi:SAM-dependent methyltransferase